ncbi:NYN domain-containing protein [Solemya velum gill symbiont]|nr:NYN domain-containing protein [Solemya velum gill symbiont]
MTIKIGVFVDAENVRYNGGFHLRYDILRRFASRGERNLIRLNTYLLFDQERANEDAEYAKKALSYQQIARQFGWKANIKNIRRYTDDEGQVSIKGSTDLDLAVDALQQADHLKGCRVELLGFDNVSRQLQRQVDTFYSGFLIPNLIPVTYEPRNNWGKPGSVVRGVCSKWFQDKGFGFLNFLDRIDDNSWITNTRLNESPWTSAFCHINEIAGDINEDDLVHGDTVLEFYVQESPQEENGLVAQNVRLVQA